MTVKECYEAFGGNYEDAFSRLRSDDTITSLGNSSQILTEALRNREQYGDDLIPLYENVKKDYEDFVLSVKKMQE